MYRPRIKSIVSQTTVDIDDIDPIGSAELQLSGVWWQGQLQSNDLSSSFTGGIPPNWVDLEETFSTGTSTLQLRVSAPQQTSTLETGGSLRSNQKDLNRAKWLTPPSLHLAPQKHIVSHRLMLNGKEAKLKVWLKGDIQGSLKVKIQTTKELLLEQKSELTELTPTINLGGWSAEPWSLKTPQLYTLIVEWSSAEGELLDRYVSRTAPRSAEVDEGAFFLNGIKQPLMGARLVIPENPEMWPEQLPELLGAGINFLEVHGALVPDSLLSWADRVGMGIVVVPRCIGRSNKAPGEKKDLEATMAAQDRRLLRQLRPHPSVLLLVLEGVDAGLKLYSSELQESDFLLGGLDFPSGRMQVEPRRSLAHCLPQKNCAGSWITEVTLSGMRQKTNWKQVVDLQRSALSEQPIGMVIPRPREGDWQSWQEHYLPFAQAWGLGEASLLPEQRSVSGTAGTLQWLDQQLTQGVILPPSGVYSWWE